MFIRSLLSYPPTVIKSIHKYFKINNQSGSDSIIENEPAIDHAKAEVID